MDTGLVQAGGRLSRRSYLPYLTDPVFYLQLGLIAMLCVLIVYPAILLVMSSFRGADGEFSVGWYVLAYSDPKTLSAIVNTVVMAVGTAALSIVVGTFLAWAVVRTDMPGRKLIEMTSIVAFISTPFVGAIAWVLLASPHTGLLNQFWRFLGGQDVLLEIYSMSGIIFVGSLYEMPFVFLIVAGALRSMDASLEEASLASGASIWKTTSRVTLPLVLPAILGSGFLVFVLTAEQFAVPAILGSPAKIRVLTTSIVESQASYPARPGLAAALSIILLVIAFIGLWLQTRMLRSQGYTTIGGKGSRPQRLTLGGWRWVVFGLCSLYLLFAVVLPYSTIFLASIRTIWTSDIRWAQLTWHNYSWVLFEYPISQRAILNSLLLATVGATITMIMAALISFLSLRSRLPGGKILDYLAIVPLGFPGIVLATALLQAWIAPPFVLYGTLWILLIAYVVRYLPIGVRSTSATLVQISGDLEEASLSSGASWFRTFRSITIPLLKTGIFAGWVLLFITFSRELSSSILLYSPQNEVFSVAMYDLFEQGEFGALSALTVLQVLLAVVTLLLVKRVIGLDKILG